jgi:trk system potassium uptake protein
MVTRALRPGPADLELIGFYLGKVLLGLGLLMLLPAALALGLGEWNSATSFVIGAALCLIVWALSDRLLSTAAQLRWAHGMVVVALAWLVGAVFAAVPMHLSGNFGDPLDSLFEAMSGLTTTGMSVVHDLDHLSVSMDLYRHLLQISGGLGIVIVVLSLFSGGSGGIATLYAAEARDERVLPNIVRTARFIFLVAGSWMVLATTALTIALTATGFTPSRALYHAINLFFSSFSTGGFSPMQASMIYYHSFAVELIVMIVMLAGTLSFGLHLALWRGDPRDVFRHLESRTLAVSTVLLFTVLTFGLVRSGTYGSVEALVRKGFFTLLSAVSSTGHQVNVGDTYGTDWGVLAPAAIVIAMAIGGMASSTAGGIKAIRVGIAFKSVVHDIRKLLMPESALVVTTYRMGRRQILRDQTVRAATSVLLLFVISFFVGALVGLAYGEFDITQTLFESVSVGANIGISIGVVGPDMPRGLQAIYLVQMWLGRLEFVAVLVLLGYLVSFAKTPTKR